MLNANTGEFVVGVDGNSVTYTKFNDIPDSIDYVESYNPNYPPAPHSINEHESIARLGEDFESLIDRASGSPPATRIGDADVAHCSGMVRAQGSENVFVNGIPWSRQGDINTPHLLPGNPCPVHTAPIATGSRTVIVNGVGAGRVGDSISGCTQVAQGSPNVYAGG